MRKWLGILRSSCLFYARQTMLSWSPAHLRGSFPLTCSPQHTSLWELYVSDPAGPHALLHLHKHTRIRNRHQVGQQQGEDRAGGVSWDPS
jgi:hypothetical protein